MIRKLLLKLLNIKEIPYEKRGFETAMSDYFFHDYTIIRMGKRITDARSSGTASSEEGFDEFLHGYENGLRLVSHIQSLTQNVECRNDTMH